MAPQDSAARRMTADELAAAIAALPEDPVDRAQALGPLIEPSRSILAAERARAMQAATTGPRPISQVALARILRVSPKQVSAAIKGLKAAPPGGEADGRG